MSLTQLFNQKTVFSLEVFPPKKSSPAEAILPTLKELKSINPDFISVTLGAGGTGRDNGTVEIASLIQNDFNTPAVAHIPGLYQTKSQVLDLLDRLEKVSVTNVLALRGDRIAGKKPAGDFQHANELVSFIKEKRPEFSVCGACYPTCHYDAANIVEDVKNLKLKVDAGADHLISQVFFDNNSFYDFREKTQLAGINVPIEAGIMPCTNRRQIEHIAKIANVPLPKKFTSVFDRYENDKQAMKQAGIAFAVDQIIDLVSQGVDGIHLYAMNHADVAKEIWRETKSIFEATQKA